MPVFNWAPDSCDKGLPHLLSEAVLHGRHMDDLNWMTDSNHCTQNVPKSLWPTSSSKFMGCEKNTLPFLVATSSSEAPGDSWATTPQPTCPQCLSRVKRINVGHIFHCCSCHKKRSFFTTKKMTVSIPQKKRGFFCMINLIKLDILSPSSNC